MIDGVEVIQLKRIPDERGAVLKVLSRDDPHFAGFGEVFISTVHPGAIKGWHASEKAVRNYCVVKGMIKLVLYDDRPASKTKGEISEMFIGDDNYCLVKIPTGVWSGFKGIGSKDAMVMNIFTEPYAYDAVKRLDPYDPKIKYDWALKNK